MESASFFIALFIHLAGLVLAFGSVLATDLFGLLWVMDRMHFPQVVRVSAVTEKFIWIGWVIMILAGIPLLIIKGIVDNLTIIKLFFVALIGLNGIFLHWVHKHLQDWQHAKKMPKLILFRMSLGIFVSQLSWWGAIVIGFMHRHIWTVIQWPDSPWLVSFLIFLSLAVLWGGGELLLKEKKAG